MFNITETVTPSSVNRKTRRKYQHLMDNFMTWFCEQNRKKDLKNQEELISSAKYIKENLNNLNDVSKSKNHKWLFEKIEKQLEHRGCLRERTIESICDEILDENNSSALLHYGKSPRKQGVENLQRKYIKDKFNIEILSGASHGLTASGPKSIRLSKTGELLYGVRMDRNKHRKSFDGKIIIQDNWLTFQKVTTDDGGSTDGVYDEVYETIECALKCLQGGKNDGYRFLFILDGEYWKKKSKKSDNLTRFETLKKLSNESLQIVDSNTVKEILE